MAPNLAHEQHCRIRDMIDSGSLTNAQIAEVARCSARSIRSIRVNLRDFGSTTAPRNRPGPPRTITADTQQALQDHLLEHPTASLSEMVEHLRAECHIHASTEMVRRELVSMGWSRKITRRVAAERNADLRDFYLHKISAFRSSQLIFVDESACDRRCAFRKRGWSPRGVTPVQTARFHRGPRYQILPAYCQDGILLSRVYEGGTDAAWFEDFVEQLLHHCRPYPEPKSVLVMDNATIHHSPRVRELCEAAGVVLVYLPPYSPDFNPIELFFAVLKSYIKQTWPTYLEDPMPGFRAFLEHCVDVVGADISTAEGHFRHVGLSVEHP